MFDATKYNWAITQIETTMAFDLGGTDFMIDWCKQFFGEHHVRESIIGFKKENRCSFNDAVSACMASCLQQPYDETDPLDVASSKASKKCYLTVLAAIGIKEGAFMNPAQAISFLRDGYRDYELGELAL